VTGVDGSTQSRDAAAVAASLARRFLADLTTLAALGGKIVDIDRVRDAHPSVEVDPRPPVDTLVDPARGADLIVIGSRGRHGLGLLGSVSERVAHRAGTSVLILRVA
jgi:nucleotide-binding universal stress UspA family protein